jgi:hypothetical protein
MLVKYIGFACCTVALASFAWAGCSSDDVTITPADAGTDRATEVDPPDTGAAPDPSRILGPGEVRFTFDACPATTPCGGDPKGVWSLSEGGCLAELSTEICPALRVVDSFVKAKGTVTITATTIKREIATLVQATVELPKSCARGLSCSFVATGLKLPPPNGAGFDVAECVDGTAADTCVCKGEKRLTETTESDYTVSGNTIVTSDQRYDFCVEGTKMTYRDKFQGEVDANIVMTKK